MTFRVSAFENESMSSSSEVFLLFRMCFNSVKLKKNPFFLCTYCMCMAFIHVDAAMCESGFPSVFILPDLRVGVYRAW
jgi:hypothetical protein